MLLPELWTQIFALCSSKDRSILCQVSNEWQTMAIKVSSQMSPLGELYYNQGVFIDNFSLYHSGDYHLIVRLKRKYNNMYPMCRSGNIDVIKLMVSHGTNDWNWGLFGACESGHTKLVKMMVSLGAEFCHHCLGPPSNH